MTTPGAAYYQQDTEKNQAKRIAESVEVGAADTAASIGIGMLGDMATNALVGSTLGPVGTVAAVAGVVVVAAVAAVVASNVAAPVVNFVSNFFSGW